MDIASAAGTIAAVCMIFGYLPQAVYTIRTRETDSIAVPTFLLMGLGALFFTVQGIAIGNVPLVVTNSITFLCSAVIFGIKMYNDHFRGRGKRRKK